MNEPVCYDRYILSVKEKALFMICGYAAGFFLLLVFYNDFLLSAAGGLACVFFLPMYKAHLGSRRKALLETQFRDFLYAVASSVAAGRQLERALEDAEQTLLVIYPPSSPLCRELAAINRAVREERGDEAALLRDLADRSGSEDIRDFVEVYVLCRKLGGDMEEVIRNTSSIMTDKMAVRREIRTLTAQKQLEGRIISVMPVLVIMGLNVFSPEYLSVLYTTISGRLIMTAALAGIAVAFLMTQKLLDIRI
ncbi:MAG: type II secretion system F family protein [Clostridiales bacterium]|nr:type II secretion system F family protein [Clostridiales bacterium]